METAEAKPVQSPPLASLASWVRLNVGGTIFATTRTTLAKDPHSFLYRVCRSDDELESHKVSATASIINTLVITIIEP